MTWASFVENGKVSLRFLFPIAVVSACFLFLPDDWKAKLSIDKVSEDYSKYFGIAFLLSVVLILTDIVLSVSKGISSSTRNKKIDKYVNDFVNSLANDEKALLREFYINGRDTLPLPIYNPTVLGLISKRILVQIGTVGTMVNYEACMSYAVSEIAKKYLTNENIMLPKEQTEANIKLIENNRFRW
ncbi:superinfection exclusion B family protein [Pedobacter sandarakinus]|uniref:superinfection exclusion B family protein n=1 Tax=Pedobacter sandarakinus TaxID=353156 RepID=UPI002247BEDB|nr:superinfection exclusion B family protein [Pedobacter sandarakinus]MCX2574860.1 superinfection exclusion B family protein [Pedobacter sandarakinus]